MVEFALILPIFILILVGIFDVGRAVYAYNTVNNAAREGARHAIVDQTVAHIQSAASQHAVSLNIDDGDIDVTFELASGGACTQLGSPQVNQCVAVVEVPYEYSAATPLIGNLVGVLQLTGRSTFPIEFDCIGTACPLGD